MTGTSFGANRASDILALDAALSRLSADYWYDVDHNAGRNAHEFFVEQDAVYQIQDQIFAGREAIKGFYAWREGRGERVRTTLLRQCTRCLHRAGHRKDDFDPAAACRRRKADPSNRGPDTDRRCGRHMPSREWGLALQVKAPDNFVLWRCADNAPFLTLQGGIVGAQSPQPKGGRAVW